MPCVEKQKQKRRRNKAPKPPGPRKLQAKKVKSRCGALLKCIHETKEKGIS